ncbi:ParB/RepB/Spo0J family partition protein [Pediococcus acidilactici]|uniref:ParB/RepB/Spo0J family partition protein n=1 Tax=Pediococcus acidilactici TaxID=1254 RepID=UPI0019503F3D|nr:ParB/RepB/Spo0J family partition protein [Pediococcus acidilactici]MBM6603289.1 ParB/RepB/Spo0J family partition protein [Pediococcus acidilactici]MBM6642738.1 ParB/RepB/Spo0J family partition protein [Pediococcus acidilactici]
MNEKQLEIQLNVPENASYQMVEVDKIRPNPFQPRRIFDKKKLAELADSIRESGIFQPLVLRQPIAAIERYEIIAGERRYRASIIAGLTKVPAIIRDFSDETTREAAIVENLQREDLSPLEEAEAYQAMIQELGLTQAQVSQRLGKSRPYIANYLRLLGLPTMVKQLLQDGKLSMGQARTLLGLKQERQLEQMAQRTVKENLTVRQLEAMVNQINAAKTKKAKKLPQRRRSPFVREIENQLAERLGTKAVVLEKSKQKGKIEIDYESLQDLDRILEILNISID